VKVVDISHVGPPLRSDWLAANSSIVYRLSTPLQPLRLQLDNTMEDIEIEISPQYKGRQHLIASSSKSVTKLQ
jgi:hypothetical protein